MALIIPEGHGQPQRDDRYGTVHEIVGGQPPVLHRFGLAVVSVDPLRRSPAHYHHRTEEIYHILEGRARMRLGSEEVEIGPGATVCIPIGTIHSIENLLDQPLRFVCVTAPPDDITDDLEVDEAQRPRWP